MLNRYQLSGFDDRDRGFTRDIELRQSDGQFLAVFRYEHVRIATGPHETERAALLNLIQQLQKNGYTFLRSRLHFRGDQYLGNQEPWEAHPDAKSHTLFTWLAGALSRLWKHPAT